MISDDLIDHAGGNRRRANQMNTYVARYNLNDGEGDRRIAHIQADTIEAAIAHVRKAAPAFRKATTRAIVMPGHISDRYELTGTRGRWAEVWQIGI
jgi:DUF1009 family protein